MRKRQVIRRLFLWTGLLAVVAVAGCRKKTPAEPPTAEQTQRQTSFQSSPDVIVCELSRVKLDKADLPENTPYFVRDMERNNEKTLLRGELTIENTDFVVLLPAANDRGLGQSMALYEKSANRTPYWWGADELKSVHRINGRCYQFAVLDNRTRFAARPYTGPTGLFQVGKGGRDIGKAEFSGSVESEQVAAAVGDVSRDGWSEATAAYELPVGDYRPSIMNVTYDDLSVSISYNYHRDAQGRERSDRQGVYGIAIRKDTPYVLDFSNTPAVVFDTPAPDRNRFKRGEEITFAAVLVDPELDIMIRGLRDTAVDVEQEYTDAAGNKQSYTTKKSLDPTVTVARADGEVVAEGVMPFG